MSKLNVASAVLLVCIVSRGVEGGQQPRTNSILEWNAIAVATVAGLNPFAPSTASAEAAAIAAAHTALRTVVPAAAAALDTARAASLSNLPDGPSKTAGLSVGDAAGAAMVAARASDGSAPSEFHWPSSLEPGEWQTTPPCPAAGYGDIHFRFDQRAGGQQGTRVGAWVYTHRLRKRDGGHDK